MASAQQQQLHVGPHEVRQPAMLYVAAETGELCTDDEFNDWYSNEHVPIRMSHIPDFETGARYIAVDGKKPTYSALYEVTDFQLFSHPKYTQLRANRSPREAALVTRLEALDRRTCKTISDTGRVSTGAKDTAPFITSFEIQPSPGQDTPFASFFDQEYLPAVKKLPGWLRSVRHEVVDSLLTSAGNAPKTGTAPKYFIVNEWKDESAPTPATEMLSSHSAQQSLGNQSKIETRSWKLYRAWDNTSKKTSARLPPLYPPPGTSEIGDKIRARRGVRGLTPLDGALMNAPALANGWNTMVGAVRNGNSLTGDVRELMILRVAARNGAAYEWIHHEHVGRDGGLTTEQLVKLRDVTLRAPSPENPAPFTPIQAAAFAYADASTFHSKIPDGVYRTLRQELSKQLPKGVTLEQQLTEVFITTGAYNMVSRFLLAADVDNHANVMMPFPGVHCQERTLYIEPGVTINAYVVKHDPVHSKPWIIFVNSLLTDYTMWQGAMARLSPHYNIVAYDQRGHGKSSVPPVPCTIEQLADDIAMIMHQLNITAPVKAVIGISQGGATTLAFAIRHTDKYEKIVVCDTQIKSPEANRKAWDDRIALAKAKGMSALADATLPRWFPGGSQLISGAQENLVRPMIENTKLEGFIAGARALQGYDLSGGISQALEGKHALFIAGQKDGALPEGMKKLADQLKSEGRDASYFEVPNAGHLPTFLDNGLAEWLDGVEPFLSA